MFDELIRAARDLEKKRAITISIPLDDGGFFDRECPSSQCGGGFKVHFDDWKSLVSDERVCCPFCRHEEKASEWNTPEQLEHFQSAARAEMTKVVHNVIGKAVARTRPQVICGPLNISMSLSYKPGHIPPVVPANATAELRQQFACEKCACRFASLGASFFCPACGHNSATSCFDSTLDTVSKVLTSLPALESAIERDQGADAARDAGRQLLEDQFARLVGAFERLNESLFDNLANEAQFPRKGSVFQRLDDASTLWASATGKAYCDFLSPGELSRLKLLFQRRHVFSHRQGIVDAAYISKSGDTAYEPGQRLVVKGGEVLELVSLLKKLSSGLRTVRASK